MYLGNSLRAMHDYFPLANRIVGIDIDPNCKNIEFDFKKNNAYVLIGSQDDREFLTHVDDMHGPFDMILDDASHDGKLTIAAFKILFPMLKDGGMYVIEDTTAFRDELGYFQDLIRHSLNAWRKDDYISNGNDHCVDPYKMDRVPTSADPNEDAILFSIGEISYGYSSIIIRKEVKPHWMAKLPGTDRDAVV